MISVAANGYAQGVNLNLRIASQLARFVCINR